jgi:hypothetical protein
MMELSTEEGITTLDLAPCKDPHLSPGVQVISDKPEHLISQRISGFVSDLTSLL